MILFGFFQRLSHQIIELEVGVRVVLEIDAFAGKSLTKMELMSIKLHSTI